MSRLSLCCLLLITGCSIEHTFTFYSDPTAQVVNQQPATPKPSHVYLVHGIDPLDWGNLQGLQSTLIQAGYQDTKLYQFYEITDVVEDIAELKQREPSARVLIAGYSAGAESTSYIINKLHDDYDIDVDCVFYLSGISLINNEYHRPAFVPRIVNIRDASFPVPGMKLDGAVNLNLSWTWHYSSPTHPQTLKQMEQELAILDQAEGR
jgi:hypothetical protein